MKMSVWPASSYPVQDQLALAVWADANDCRGVWFADHYMPNTGDTSIVPGDCHEVYGILPAVATATQRVRLGPLVSPTSVHHPAILANRAATIDHLSQGRFVLGLGAGWQINEHHAYGIELEPPRQRVDRFEESIEIIRSLLTNERTTFQGDVFTILDATADPKPIQHPLPLLVGTKGERMMRITARWADEWNTWGNPGVATEQRSRFADACAAVGTSIDRKQTTVNAFITITEDREIIDEVTNGGNGRMNIAGPVPQLLDYLATYRDAGFDEFIVPTGNLGATNTERLEALEQIKTDLFDQLESPSGGG